MVGCLSVSSSLAKLTFQDRWWLAALVGTQPPQRGTDEAGRSLESSYLILVQLKSSMEADCHHAMAPIIEHCHHCWSIDQAMWAMDDLFNSNFRRCVDANAIPNSVLSSRGDWITMMIMERTFDRMILEINRWFLKIIKRPLSSNIDRSFVDRSISRSWSAGLWE